MCYLIADTIGAIVIREACRLRAERLPHIPMAVLDFRPFSGVTALELSAFRLGNLALLPSLTGLVSPLGTCSLPFDERIGRSHITPPPTLALGELVGGRKWHAKFLRNMTSHLPRQGCA